MEKIKKYLREISIAVLIILLLSVSYCSHNQQKVAKGEKIQLKKQLNGVKAEIKTAEKKTEKLVDSLNKEDKIKNKRIAELEKNNNDLAENSKSREKELKQQKEKIAKYTYINSSDFLRYRYDTYDVIPTETSVNLLGETPNLIVEELVEKDYMALDLDDKNKVIENKDEQIKLEQEKTLSANLKTASIQVEKELLKEGLTLSEDINKKSEKEIRKLKTKNFINRILVPVAFIGGGFLGLQLAK